MILARGGSGVLEKFEQSWSMITNFMVTKNDQLLESLVILVFRPENQKTRIYYFGLFGLLNQLALTFWDKT